MMSRQSPTWAERARTSLAQAVVGTLVVPIRPGAYTQTMVTVEARPFGRPRVWLEPSSPVPSSLGHAVVTIVVPGPSPFRCLAIEGHLEPQPRDQSGCQPYDMSLHEVRLVGSATRSVSVSSFERAEPDPLRNQAIAALQHLEATHHDDLLTCVRAHGHPDALWVMPRSLDRYGMDLATVTKEGVTSIRLTYRQGRIEAIEDAEDDLRGVLSCPCQDPYEA
ncbi:MAG: DUF2470 domain-containing protein [Ornithinimicrobium sp.]